MDTDPGSSAIPPGELAAFALVSFLLLFGVASALLLPPQQDIGAPLDLAAKLLDGSRLYVDVFEWHGPLLYWTAALAVGAARVVAIHPVLVYKLIALLHIAVALCAVWSLARSWREVAAAAFVLLPLVGFDFAQAEHLLVAGLVPYVLLARRRAEGLPIPVWAAVATGVLTAVGIARKPYYLLPWLVLEAAILWRGRRLLRSESAVVIGLGVAYVAAVALVTPEYFDFIPWALDVYRDHYAATVPEMLGMRRAQAGILAILLVVAVDRSFHGRVVAGVATTMLLSVLFVQGHGFTQHWYPLTAIPVFHLLRLILVRRWSALVVGAAAAVAMLASQIRYDDLRAWPHMLPWTRQVVAEHGGPVLALSTMMAYVHPLVSIENVRSASRFSALYMIASGYEGGGSPFPYNAPEAMGYPERFGYDATIEDFTRNRPAVLFVDTFPPRPYPPERAMVGFSWLEYFGRDPRFRAELANYEEIEPIANLRVFVRRR